jgi:hypothetical protein
MNGSPKPFIEYHLDEPNNLGNSNTGHSNEQFSEPALLQKKSSLTKDGFQNHSLQTSIFRD